MKIAVLIKEVPDPEAKYSIGDDGNVVTAGLPHIPSLFDEHALEAAIRLKEESGGSVVAICCGPAEAERTLRYALAMGADEVALIEAADCNWDSLGAARLLVAALRKLGSFDLILSGREAADTGVGQVGPFVAQSLGMPFLTLATGIEPVEGGLRVRRLWENGEDLYHCALPLLLTVCSEMNRPRYPSVMKTLAARRKPIPRLHPEELGIGPTLNSPQEPRLIGRQLPVTLAQCHLVSGETPAEMALGLLSRLRAEGVV